MGFVILRTYNNYIPANITLSRLKEAGVHCYLKDEYTVTIDPLLSNAIGGIKLAVAEEDEVLARQLLDKYQQEYWQSMTCPNCGSHNIRHVPKEKESSKKNRWFGWFFGNHLMPDLVYKCGQCGYETEDMPETEQTPP